MITGDGDLILHLQNTMPSSVCTALLPRVLSNAESPGTAGEYTTSDGDSNNRTNYDNSCPLTIWACK